MIPGYFGPNHSITSAIFPSLIKGSSLFQGKAFIDAATKQSFTQANWCILWKSMRLRFVPVHFVCVNEITTVANTWYMYIDLYIYICIIVDCYIKNTYSSIIYHNILYIHTVHTYDIRILYIYISTMLNLVNVGTFNIFLLGSTTGCMPQTSSRQSCWSCSNSLSTHPSHAWRNAPLDRYYRVLCSKQCSKPCTSLYHLEKFNQQRSLNWKVWAAWKRGN